MFGRSVSRFVARRLGPSSRTWVLGTSAPSAVTVRRLLAVLLVLTPAAVSRAEEAVQTQGADVRVPQSPQDHAELAGLYQRLATQERGQADSLRKSWAAEIKRQTPFPNKAGVEIPWLTRLKRQAQEEISRAESEAAEAERSADYHRMRAKELEGLEFVTLAAASVSPGGQR